MPGASRITCHQLNYLELAPYQCALLKRGYSRKTVEEEEVTPRLVLEYSAAVGVTVFDELASAAKHTKEGVGRLVSKLEERLDDLEERMYGVVRELDNSKVKDLYQQVLKCEANNHELEA